MHALLRDGYRCVLTGAYDFYSCKNHPDLDVRAKSENPFRINTQCAYVFCESAQEGDGTDWATSAMAILELFGLSDQAEGVVADNANQHFNIFTIAGTLPYFWNHLEFWLEEVIGEPNTYTVCAANPDFFTSIVGPPRRCVTFTVDPDVEAACRTNNKPVPALPSPSLLAIHAACCRAAHMAGAVERVEQILCDLEDTPVMAEDGSAAHLLVSRLLQSLKGI